MSSCYLCVLKTCNLGARDALTKKKSLITRRNAKKYPDLLIFWVDETHVHLCVCVCVCVNRCFYINEFREFSYEFPHTIP